MKIATLLYLCLIASCVGCVNTVVQMKPAPTTADKICAKLKINCDFPAPIIVKTQAVDDKYCFMCKYRGFTYHAEPYIFINNQMSLQEQIETEYHETVHFVLAKAGITTDRCESERIARELTAERFDWIYDDDYETRWRKSYGCLPSLTTIPGGQK